MRIKKKFHVELFNQSSKKYQKMNNNLNVETIGLENIEGRILYYVRFSNGEEKIHINVGESTYKKVKALIESKANEPANTVH